jgi:hypothetical protein
MFGVENLKTTISFLSLKKRTREDEMANIFGNSLKENNSKFFTLNV